MGNGCTNKGNTNRASNAVNDMVEFFRRLNYYTNILRSEPAEINNIIIIRCNRNILFL